MRATVSCDAFPNEHQCAEAEDRPASQLSDNNISLRRHSRRNSNNTESNLLAVHVAAAAFAGCSRRALGGCGRPRLARQAFATMAAVPDAIAEGYSPMYHDETLRKFGATFLATGKDAAFVEYTIKSGTSECDGSKCLRETGNGRFEDRIHRMHVLAGFAGGGALDMHHTFTDPEHRGKVIASSR